MTVLIFDTKIILFCRLLQQLSCNLCKHSDRRATIEKAVLFKKLIIDPCNLVAIPCFVNFFIRIVLVGNSRI